jgi:hypothetical protein
MMTAFKKYSFLVIFIFTAQACKKTNGYAPDPTLTDILFPATPTQRVDLGDGTVFNGTGDSLQTNISVKTADSYSISVVFKANVTNVVGHIVWEGLSTANGWGNTLAAPNQETHISIGNVCGPPFTNCPAGQTISPQADLLTFFLGDTQQAEDSGVLNISIPFIETTAQHIVSVSIENLSTVPKAYMYLDGLKVGEDLIGNPLRVQKSSFNNLMKVASPGAAQRYFNGSVSQVMAAESVLNSSQAYGLCIYFKDKYNLNCQK